MKPTNHSVRADRNKPSRKIAMRRRPRRVRGRAIVLAGSRLAARTPVGDETIFPTVHFDPLAQTDLLDLDFDDQNGDPAAVLETFGSYLHRGSSLDFGLDY